MTIRLPPNGANELKIWRRPQDDMAMSVDCKKVEESQPDAITDLLHKVMTGSSVRSYLFHSLTGTNDGTAWEHGWLTKSRSTSLPVRCYWLHGHIRWVSL